MTIRPVGRFLVVPLAFILSFALPAMTPGRALAAQSIHVSRAYIAPGDSITVTGSGFAPNDDVVADAAIVVASKPNRLQAATQADASGNFSVVLTMPGGTTQGTYTVFARDFHGHVASQRVNVLPLAYLKVGATAPNVYVIPLHSFYASGAGFAPGETVALAVSFPQYDGNSIVVNRTATADKNGTFYEVGIRVPRAVHVGTYVLKATGATSKKVAYAKLVVNYRPTVTLTSAIVRPGTAVGVHGREFVPDTTVHVSVTVSRNAAGNVTIARTVTADGNGNFDVALDLPSSTRTGRYTVSAVDVVGNVHASTPVNVSVHPSIALDPPSVLPGEAVTVSGENFASGVTVTIIGTFPVSGGNRTVTVYAPSGGRGNYSARLVVPADAVPGRAKLIARAGGAQTATTVQVKPRPATSTPVPATGTPVATAAPAETPTAMPTTTTQKKGFGFRYVSIWYHTVRAGTYNHVVVQGSLKVTQGMWMHVYFPSGAQLAFYQNTTNRGKFEIQFNIPKNAITASNNKVVVTFRLWHGAKSRRFFASFNLVR